MGGQAASGNCVTTGGALSTAMAGTSSYTCLWPDSISLCTFARLTDSACEGFETEIPFLG